MEEKEEKKEHEDVRNEIIEETEEQMMELEEKGIDEDTIGYLYKLVDIHKDLKNEIYWEEKMMRYRNYGNYNGNYGNYGANFDNYSDSGNYGYGSYGRGSYGYGEGSYGRRGYDTKYRGDESLGRMSDGYGRYMENRERYGASQETDKSFHYMVEAYKDFGKVLMEEADSQEQKEMLKQAMQQTMQMM